MILTAHRYIKTHNTGAAGYGIWTRLVTDDERKSIVQQKDGRWCLPASVATSGARLAFFGEDCIGDGREWHEAYEWNGTAWVIAGFRDSDKAKTWMRELPKDYAEVQS